MTNDREIMILRSLLADALHELKWSCPNAYERLQARLDRLDAKLEGDDQ